MKHVFTGKTIDHAWVHRQAPWGNTGTRGNESFDGDRFFSYSTCIAERLTVNKKDIYFISRYRYSSSTGSHINGVRHAIPATCEILTVIGVRRGTRNILPDKPDRKRWAQEEIGALLKEAGEQSASAARSPSSGGYKLNYARELVDQAKRFAEIFKVKIKVDTDLAKLGEQVEELRKKAQAFEREQQKKLLAANKEALDKWLSGDPRAQYPTALLRRGEFNTRLRVTARAVDGVNTVKVVETSLGITIDYREAQAALKWLLSHRVKGWRTNGEQFKIAGYNVSSVSETGVIAGCHRVRWDEIERIAKQEGWSLAA